MLTSLLVLLALSQGCTSQGEDNVAEGAGDSTSSNPDCVSGETCSFYFYEDPSTRCGEDPSSYRYIYTLTLSSTTSTADRKTDKTVAADLLVDVDANMPVVRIPAEISYDDKATEAHLGDYKSTYAYRLSFNVSKDIAKRSANIQTIVVNNIDRYGNELLQAHFMSDCEN